jgi:hypothetical protein
MTENNQAWRLIQGFFGLKLLQIEKEQGPDIKAGNLFLNFYLYWFFNRIISKALAGIAPRSGSQYSILEPTAKGI